MKFFLTTDFPMPRNYPFNVQSLKFFKASYLYVAKKLNLTLITEDMELKNKAEKAGIEAKTTEEI